MKVTRALRARLEPLAQAWQQTGAAKLELFEGEESLIDWTFAEPDGQPPLIVPVSSTIQFRLYGNPENALVRLKADAALVGELLRAEIDLQATTTDLIDAQDQLLALYDLTRAIRHEVSIPAMLRVLTEQVARLLKADWARARLDTFNAVYPPNSSEQDAMQALLKGSYRNQLATLPIPLANRREALLTLFAERGFSAAQMKLARAITEQVGAYLEILLIADERLEQAKIRAELDLTGRIQTTLLPSMAIDIPGLQIFARTLPAYEAGGDFYNMSERRGGLLCALGDVAGKGLPAALLMAMIHTVWRGWSRSGISLSPSQILSLINNDLHDDMSAMDMFATAFCARYGGRQLMISNAGHAPVVLCKRASTPELLIAEDVPLGILPDIAFQEQTIPFDAGDVLVVCSDGFVEAQQENDLFGIERLLEQIEAIADRSAEEIGLSLYEAVARFSAGRNQDDDMTVMVLKGE